MREIIIIQVPSGRKWEKVGNMFFGSYEHTLDEKGRLVIPCKMREECGVKLYIMKGFDGALSLYKVDDFEKLAAEVSSLSFKKKDSRAYLRVRLASACELDIDKQGRIQIPTQILNKYEIGKEVVVIGVGDHIEVWNKAAYKEYEKAADDSFESIAENLDDEQED